MSPPSSRRSALRRLADILVFLVVLALNGLAGSGALSGESTGLIANRYRSAFRPADYVFGIWSLIWRRRIVQSREG